LPAPASASLLPSEAQENSPGREIAALLTQWAQARLGEPLPPGGLYERFLALVEPPLLRAALAAHKGACAPAAQTLGLHRTTLRKKLDQHGIDGSAQ